MGTCCSAAETVPINPNQVDLSHFDMLKVVGRGGFGKVNAVENRIDKKLYAMKTLKKSTLLKSTAHLRTMWAERNVMCLFKSNFLVHLHWAFQSESELFLVMHFMSGGDLRYFLSVHRYMNEPTMRFYAVELLLAMEEINSLNLIYRDLKPENLLLDEEGHLRLSDFGLVYNLRESPDGMIGGEAGTQGYLAPEVYTSRYGISQDVWSYGVVLYEFMHGHVPFQNRDDLMNEDLDIYRNMSPQCRDLIQSLLSKNVATRLGCGSEGWAEVKRHPFFEGVDWETAAAKGLRPPFTPESDVANCSAVFDLEDQFFNDQKKETFTTEQQAKFHGFEYRIHEFPTAAEGVDFQPPRAPSRNSGRSPRHARRAGSPSAHHEERPPQATVNNFMVEKKEDGDKKDDNASARNSYNSDRINDYLKSRRASQSQKRPGNQERDRERRASASSPVPSMPTLTTAVPTLTTRNSSMLAAATVPSTSTSTCVSASTSTASSLAPSPAQLHMREQQAQQLLSRSKYDVPFYNTSQPAASPDSIEDIALDDKTAIRVQTQRTAPGRISKYDTMVVTSSTSPDNLTPTSPNHPHTSPSASTTLVVNANAISLPGQVDEKESKEGLSAVGASLGVDATAAPLSPTQGTHSQSPTPGTATASPVVLSQPHESTEVEVLSIGKNLSGISL